METRRFFKLTQIAFFGLLFPLFFSSCEVFEEVLSPENNSSFIVNTTDDTSDINPGDDICEDVNGNCSLRAAVQETNTRSQVTYTIELQEGNYLLDSTLELKNPFGVLIKGKGPENTVVDGQDGVRVFQINATETSNISIHDLTISGGNPEYEFSDFRATIGGAIRVGFLNLDPESPVDPPLRINPFVNLKNVIIENNTAYAGGGIAILQGRFNMESCIVRNNSAVSVNFQGQEGGGFGGGIYNKSLLNIKNSSIYQNETRDTPRFIATNIGEGGGIFNAIDARAVITNTTIANNNTDFRIGSGISSISGSIARISNSSIIDNSRSGIENLGADSIVLANTLVSNNSINGRIYSLGGNFMDEEGEYISLGTPTSPDQFPTFGITILPMLSSFQRIGDTWGYMPLEGSPLIDQGNTANCNDIDQSGFSRSGLCDIGAIEYR